MKAYRYKIPLTQAIQLGEQRIKHREGVLLETDNGWAEASPLPHFSSESVDGVIDALRHTHQVPPSLQFALQCLNQPIAAQSLSVNALLQGTSEQILSRCRKLATSKCSTVKLKVGRNAVQTETELVHRVRAELDADQTLRLDANRAWNWETANDFASRVKELSIEYIEEPLNDPSRLDEFTQRTQLPYAIDETVCESLPLKQFERAAAIVVKPTLVGLGKRMDEVIATEKPIIFSACYESGVGLARIVQLANQYNSMAPAGLDTYSYLAEDVLINRLQIKDWRIHIPSSIEVERERLTEIPL